MLSLLKAHSLWRVVRDLIETIVPDGPSQATGSPQKKKYRKKKKKEDATELFPKIEYNDDIALGTAVSCSMDTPMRVSFGVDNNKVSSQFIEAEPEAQEKEKEKEKEFVCHYCDARFRIRGYLTRHIKKHALEKAYHCPFYEINETPAKRCHNSGGFSRRDTFKTHMKARHLVYPDGVKFAERQQSSAHCARCGAFIPKAARFVEDHLESGQCPALPMGYVSENLRKSSSDPPSWLASPQQQQQQRLSMSPSGIGAAASSGKRRNRMKKIITSNGTCRYISTLQSWVEPKVLQNKEALEAMAIMASETGRNDVLTSMDDNRFVLDAKSYVNIHSKSESKKKGRGQAKKKNFTMATTTTTTISPTCSTVKLEQPAVAEGLISPANSTSSSTGTMSNSPISHNALEPVYSDSSLTASFESIQNNNKIAQMETTNTLDHLLPNMAELDKISFDAMLAYCPLDTEHNVAASNGTTFEQPTFNDNNIITDTIDNQYAETGFGVLPQLQQSQLLQQSQQQQQQLQQIQQQHAMKKYINDNVVMPSNNNKFMEDHGNQFYPLDDATLTEMHVKETQKYMQYYHQFFNTN
uniref:Transcription factor STP1 n=1 Tax=Nakaseomyces delphensis TaxID=51657 RepID=A7WPI1_NAKDE|nr:transcription factor [Nakaseomyces delphensis]